MQKNVKSIANCRQEKSKANSRQEKSKANSRHEKNSFRKGVQDKDTTETLNSRAMTQQTKLFGSEVDRLKHSSTQNSQQFLSYDLGRRRSSDSCPVWNTGRQSMLQETIVEVPQVQNVELIRQVPKSQTQKMPKQITKPVIQVRERTVEVPQVTLREEIVEQPVPEYVEIIKEVPRNEVQQEQKPVNKPELQIVERIQEDCVAFFIEHGPVSPMKKVKAKTQDKTSSD